MKRWLGKLISLFKRKPKSKIPDQKFMRIAEYQFQNLMVNRVPCLILDLRVEEADKPKIPRAQKSTVENAVDFVKQTSTDIQHPIVIISDDGQAALVVADKLANQKYFNVVVLEGGIRALSDQTKIQIQI